MARTISVTISPKELEELKKTGNTIDLIDVRTPVEFREIHAVGALNVPLDRLDPARVIQEKRGNGVLYIICQTGNRSCKACELFESKGIANTVSVEGGTKAWVEAGLPVVRGKKAISLERQVRMAAGTLVLIGIVSGFLIHSSLFGLSAFVGAGLLFSALTDTCGMGLVLARMPWNQLADCKTSE